MGKRGPKRTPLTLLKKRGSNRAKGRPEDKERKIPEVPGVPKMPDGMSEAAQDIWVELAKILSAMKVVTVSEVYLMRDFCEMRANYDVDSLVLAKEGRYHMTPTGMKPRPELRQCDIWHANMHRMMDKMGLSPSARASLGAPTQQEPADESKQRFFAK